MCFYLSALNKKIEIVYAIEDIRLRLGGYSEINLDICIKNISGDAGDEIDKLYILHPYALANVDVGSSANLPANEACLLQDATYTIRDKQHPYNFRYSSAPYHADWKPVTGKDNDFECDLVVPNHTSAHYRTIKCFSRGVEKERSLNSLRVYVGGHYDEQIMPFCFLKMLEQFNCTIFEVKLATLIAIDETRFFRFRVRYPSTIHKIGLIKGMILRSYDSLQYLFEIASPYDVLHRFNERKELYKKSNPNGDRSLTRDEGEVFLRLSAFADQLRKSEVRCVEWKIEIHPDRFRLIHDIVLVGNITPLGVMPNIHSNTIERFCSSLGKWGRFKKFQLEYLQPHKVRAYDFVSKNESMRTLTQSENDRVQDLFVWSELDAGTYDKKYGFRIYFSARHPQIVNKFMHGMLELFVILWLLWVLGVFHEVIDLVAAELRLIGVSIFNNIGMIFLIVGVVGIVVAWWKSPERSGVDLLKRIWSYIKSQI